MTGFFSARQSEHLWRYRRARSWGPEPQMMRDLARDYSLTVLQHATDHDSISRHYIVSGDYLSGIRRRINIQKGSKVEEIQYYPNWLSRDLASSLFASLSTDLAWQQHDITLFGKTVAEPRLSFWAAETGVSYRYSGKTRYGAGWPLALSRIQQQINLLLGGQFNSILANYYRDGRDYMGWHRDNEPELGSRPVIASLSLGASRRFLFRCRNTKQQLEYLLHHGDLLVMNGLCQREWQHALPKMARVDSARINLSFRRIGVNSLG